MLEITEIKARLVNYDATISAVREYCGTPKEVINQEDLFFNCQKGKLKLRVFDKNKGDLIFYTRDKEDGIKNCKFSIYNTKEPEDLKKVLSASFTTIGSVIKKRTLYMYDNTRIHIDEVKALGDFIEIEIPINNLNHFESEEIIQKLMRTFKINSSDILEGAYIDLLQNITTKE